MFYDSPARLQEALEDGSLETFVDAKIIFDPQNVQEVQEEQILQFLLIKDILDPESDL